MQHKVTYTAMVEGEEIAGDVEFDNDTMNERVARDYAFEHLRQAVGEAAYWIDTEDDLEVAY